VKAPVKLQLASDSNSAIPAALVIKLNPPDPPGLSYKYCKADSIVFTALGMLVDCSIEDALSL
jgi:hypothetical protein